MTRRPTDRRKPNRDGTDRPRKGKDNQNRKTDGKKIDLDQWKDQIKEIPGAERLRQPRFPHQDPNWPGHQSKPNKTFPELAKSFEKLNAKTPVALLPVRIETRFSEKHLRIRIFPDQLSITSFDARLTAVEHKAANAYVDKSKDVLGDWVAERDLWLRLAATHPARRMAWAIRTLRSGKSIEIIDPEETGDRSQAPLLPDRWFVAGYADGLRVLDATSERAIDHSIFLSPDPTQLSSDEKNIKFDPAFAWMTDFDIAVQKGMALEVELPDRALNGFDELIVFGVRDPGGDMATQAARLERMFETHAYDWGAGFVPQGTATNIREGQGVWSLRDADVEGLFARDVYSKAHDDIFPTPFDELATDAALVPLGEGAAVSKMNFRRFEKALGLPSGSAVRRFQNRDGTEDALAKAMNQMLWPVTLGEVAGQFLTHGRTEYLAPQTTATLRRHFCANLRGTAVLPAFRIGSTPYGVLPISPVTPLAWTDPDPVSAPIRKRVERMARKLLPHWTNAARDGLLTAGAPAALSGFEKPGARLLEILRQDPHPIDFKQATVEDIRLSVSFNYSIAKAVVTDIQYSLPLKNAFTINDGESDVYLLPPYPELIEWPAQFSSPSHQEAVIRGLRDMIASVMGDEDDRIGPFQDSLGQLVADFMRDQNADAIAELLSWFDVLLDLMADHADRCHFLDSIGAPPDLYNKMVGDQTEDPTLAYLRDKNDLRDWPEATFVEVDKSGETVTYRSYISALHNYAAAFANGSTAPNLPNFPDNDVPLLYQLLKTSILRTLSDGEDMSRIVAALEELQPLNAAQAALLARSTLGLASWRLDAWLTGLATARLADLRAEKPEGIQIGAFGWVENLKRSEADPKERSQGYVMTPSLNHARTAAVLRAGYQAYRNEPGGGGFATDLSSARMRDAKWAFDAIRQGQDLGDLLGARFERTLLDGALTPEWIYPIRAAVRELTAATDADELGIVDGLELHRLWHEDEQALRQEAEQQMVRVAPPGGSVDLDATGLETAIHDLDGVIDALADAGLADAVHALVQGNPVRSGASLSAISTGDAPPPDMSVLETAPTGRAFTHRVAMVVPAPKETLSESLPFASYRASCDPGMEVLAASFIDQPKGWTFHYHIEIKSDVQAVAQVTWSDLRRAGAPHDFGALDLMSMLPDGPMTPDCRLWRWIARFIRTRHINLPKEARIIPSTGPETDVLTDQLDRARAWAAVIVPARVLAARDLNEGDATATTHPDPNAVTALRARVKTAEDTFVEAAKVILSLAVDNDENETDEVALSSSESRRLREKLLVLHYFGIHEAIIDIQEEQGAILVRTARSFKSRIADSLEQLAALRLLNVATPAEELKALRKRLKVLFGRTSFGAIPIDPNETAAKGTFANTDTRLGGSVVSAFEWLEKWGYVRAPLRTLNDALLLDGDDPSVAVGQWPETRQSPWVGLHAPQDDKIALSMIALATTGAEKTMSGSLIGVVVDDVVDRIPAEQTDAGVALHFDAPGSEAPQTVLLAIPPEDKEWSHDVMVDTLRTALELTRIRGVDGATMPDFNQIIPAVFADDGTRVAEG